MFFLLASVSFVICLSLNIHKIHIKKLVFLNIILLLSFVIFSLDITRNQTFIGQKYSLSNIISFDNNWQFYFDRNNWTNVTLPHSFRIEQINQQWQGTCFYRKQLIIKDNSSHMILRFDAAMYETDIWINNEPIARHLGGYLPFDIDLPLSRSRILNILVQLRNTDNSLIPRGKNLSELDFNYYGGLYGHVWLIQKSNQFRLNHSIHIHYENVSKTQSIIVVRFHIITNSNNLKDCHIQFLLNGREVYPLDTSDFGQAKFFIYNPRLWSPSQPNLYDFSIELLDVETKKIVFDQQTIKIGIRSFEIRPNSQYLFINGEKFDYLVGTNRHQEYPYIGYALSDSAQYRDAYKIKQAGFNLVRCSHYPPSTAFLNACDYLGILVITSIPDWQYFGNATFERNSLNDIKRMIERDYNHPSIFLWDISLNESPMSQSFMIKAYQLVKKEKPDGLTCGSIDEENAYDVFMPARQYAPDYYKNYRAKTNKILLIGESKERNFNQTESSISPLISPKQTSRQRRKDGQKRLLTHAKNVQQTHNDNRRSSQTARIMGDANWLMFDYAQDIEASGIMDINRLPKFAFYFYQSQCTSCPPMIFIANYWINSSDTTVIVYTNCDDVELRLNDKRIVNGGKQQDQDSSHLLRPPFIFQIDQYIPGRLQAIGFINGKSVAQTYRSTPGRIHHHLGMEIDSSGKPLTNNDVIFIYVYIYDEQNAVIPNADDFIQFSLSNAHGQALFIGKNPVRAEAGIASILLKTSSVISHSKITVKASSSTVQKQETHLIVDITR